MAAKYILAVLSVVFLSLGVIRIASGGMKAHPQSRAWLLIGMIFGAVSAYLFYQA
jgi:hypothetical protein